jgi:hypothetical protein
MLSLTSLSFTLFQFWGTVAPPPGVADYGDLASGGLITFVSNIIRIITIIAGVWSLFNIVFAGFTYITSANDAKGIEKAWQSIYMSLIGMIIIVAAFTITAIFSWILFGDATFILNPIIIGVK